MRIIRKGPEPTSLTKYRLAKSGSYDDFPEKDSLRGCVLRDQRGLCCYCLSRIPEKDGRMKIEHWRSQKRYPDEQLDYSNLLGACLGSEGQPGKNQHCDTRKGDRDLSKNPANPDHRVEDLIRYGSDGQISSDDSYFDSELNNVLNLNLPFLKNNRKNLLTAFQKGLEKRHPISRTQLERWLREWNGEGDSGELKEFCQVIVYWLRKRLSRA